MEKSKWVMLILTLVLVISILPVAGACAKPAPPAPAPAPTPAPAPKPAGPTPAEFYKGKTLHYVVAAGVGTSNDMIARAMIPKIKEYTGAEAVIIVYKTAGGDLEALNYMAGVKNDGLTFAEIDISDSFILKVRKDPAMRYDPEKFTYLASSSPPDPLFPVITKKGKYLTIADLQQGKNLKGAVAQIFGDYHLTLITFAALLNLDAKIVGDMRGGDRILSLLNNTLDMSIFSVDYLSRYPDLIPLATNTAKRFPGVNAPTFGEIAPKDLSPDLKAMVSFVENVMTIGNMFISTPGVPADRAAFLSEALRKAYKDILVDAQKFLGLSFTMDDLVPPEKALATYTETLKAGTPLAATMEKLFEKYKA